MRKIGVLAPDENKNHISFYMSIIQELNSFEIVFFTNEWTKNQLKEIALNNVSFIKKDNDETFYSYYRRNKIQFKSCCLLICEELYTGFFPYLIFISTLKIRKTLCIHNVNKWFNQSITLNPRIIIYSLLRKVIITSMDSFLVISPNLKKYINENHMTKKPVFFLPFTPTLYKPSKIKKVSNENIKLVIPGGVDCKRRDYDLVFNALEILFSNKNYNIELFLLGKIVDDKISSKLIDRSTQINKTYGKKIHFWTDFVPKNTFENVMRDADFIINNVQLNYKNNTIQEIYGKTKETGISYLILEYKKPCIISSSLIPMRFTERQSIIYNDLDELILILQKMSAKLIVPDDFNYIISQETYKYQKYSSDQRELIIYYINSL